MLISSRGARSGALFPGPRSGYPEHSRPPFSSLVRFCLGGSPVKEVAVHNKFFYILFGLLCLFILCACVWAPGSGSTPSVSSSGGILTDAAAAAQVALLPADMQ